MNAAWHLAPGVEPDERLTTLLENLEEKPVSRLTRHTAACCEAAESWFRSTARAAARRFDEEPRWISERWRWGPTTWPIAWCEAIRARALDCGALADFAEAAFEEAGREVMRVQLIEQASREECEQWAARWAAVPSTPRWIWGRLVYHEVVGVLNGENVRVWNPTDGVWQERLVSRVAHVRAIRLLTWLRARTQVSTAWPS